MKKTMKRLETLRPGTLFYVANFECELLYCTNGFAYVTVHGPSEFVEFQNVHGNKKVFVASGNKNTTFSLGTMVEVIQKSENSR